MSDSTANQVATQLEIEKEQERLLKERLQGDLKPAQKNVKSHMIKKVLLLVPRQRECSRSQLPPPVGDQTACCCLQSLWGPPSKVQGASWVVRKG